VQLAAGVNEPVPLLVNKMVPVGVLVVPGEVSVTVAVHVEGEPIWTDDGLQTIAVAVVRGPMLTVALPELVL